MTFLVSSDAEDKVEITPPIVRKFKGQHIKNLVEWMKRQGNFEYEELTVLDPPDFEG